MHQEENALVYFSIYAFMQAMISELGAFELYFADSSKECAPLSYFVPWKQM